MVIHVVWIWFGCENYTMICKNASFTCILLKYSTDEFYQACTSGLELHGGGTSRWGSLGMRLEISSNMVQQGMYFQKFFDT